MSNQTPVQENPDHKPFLSIPEVFTAMDLDLGEQEQITSLITKVSVLGDELPGHMLNLESAIDAYVKNTPLAAKIAFDLVTLYEIENNGEMPPNFSIPAMYLPTIYTIIARLEIADKSSAILFGANSFLSVATLQRGLPGLQLKTVVDQSPVPTYGRDNAFNPILSAFEELTEQERKHTIGIMESVFASFPNNMSQMQDIIDGCFTQIEEKGYLILIDSVNAINQVKDMLTSNGSYKIVDFSGGIEMQQFSGIQSLMQHLKSEANPKVITTERRASCVIART